MSHYITGEVSTKHFIKENISFDKGELVGGFKLGSTVVLVFDCDADYQWKVKPNEKVRVGQALLG